MKKKMLIFFALLVVLFLALYFVMDYKNKQTIENNDNPYGKTDLKQATFDQLDDPNYQNQITPDELAKRLGDNEDVTVYFYSSTCSHCLKTTPILVPIAEELGVDMKKFNLWEFDDRKYWETYGIEGTPTLVHYENGKEVDRISGEQSKEVFRAFFDEHVLDK